MRLPMTTTTMKRKRKNPLNVMPFPCIQSRVIFSIFGLTWIAIEKLCAIISLGVSWKVIQMKLLGCNELMKAFVVNPMLWYDRDLKLTIPRSARQDDLQNPSLGRFLFRPPGKCDLHYIMSSDSCSFSGPNRYCVRKFSGVSSTCYTTPLLSSLANSPAVNKFSIRWKVFLCTKQNEKNKKKLIKSIFPRDSSLTFCFVARSPPSSARTKSRVFGSVQLFPTEAESDNVFGSLSFIRQRR